MGFGMLSERLAVTLLRAGLLGLSARKYTTIRLQIKFANSQLVGWRF